MQDTDDEGNPVGDPYPADPSDLSIAASGASNQGPTNPDLLAAIEERTAAYREANGLADDVPVPIDAVTGIGLRASTRTSPSPTPACRPHASRTSAACPSTRCWRWSTTTPPAGPSGSSARRA